jgi:ATP-dependent Clp protease ATP-binding subunit ClpA
MEKFSVSRLIGAPPGYVGYDRGGLLTEKVRNNPHCVLLLDEIEKAHPDIFNVLLQIMDSARLTDNNGREADFRNVIVIMTSNAGAADLQKQAVGFGRGVDVSKSLKAIEKQFSPEFRNRLDEVVIFDPLPMDVVTKVVDKFVRELEFQLSDRNVTIELTPAAKKWVAEEGYDEVLGARPLSRVIQDNIKSELADEILFGELQHGGNVIVDIDKSGDEPELTFEFEPIPPEERDDEDDDSGDRPVSDTLETDTTSAAPVGGDDADEPVTEGPASSPAAKPAVDES